MRKVNPIGFVAMVASLALGLGGCAHTATNAVNQAAARAQRTREVQALIADASAGSLAAAAWLSQAPPNDLGTGQSLDLIARAISLAPDRPEIAWLHLAICKRLKCDGEAQIEARLKVLDPTNGFVWALDLERAYGSGSEAAITDAISRIGAATKVSDYWNQLEVIMFDALTVADPSKDVAERGFNAIGIAAATPVPALQAMSKACRLEQLDQPGRRVACEAMLARLEQSSAVLTQSLALSIEERWWPTDSPEREVVRAKRRRLDYLVMTSAAIRWWHLNRDMAVRIDAARHSEREEDVEIAIMKSRGLPLEPPADWKDTWHPG